MSIKIDKNDYKPLKVSECVVGNVVILTHPNYSYTIGKNNPEINSRHFCEGVVRAVRGTTVEVLWNNNCANLYNDYEISLAERSNIISIW